MYSHFDSNTWVTPFGLVFLVAIFTAWLLARRNAVSINIDGSHIDLLIPVTIIVGIAGGTVLSLLMPMDQMIAGDRMQTGVRVRLFGMLATGAAALFVYSRIVKLSFRRLLDVFALPTLAGLMIHRIGCFLAGCCWGDIVSNEHATDFASQVQTLPYQQHLALDLIEPSALASLPVYPVQLYEGALLLVLMLALWRFPWRRFPAGVLAVVVVCAYAFLRFFIEYLRADGPVVLGNMTVTQLQCLFLLLGGVLLPGMIAGTRGKPSVKG